MKIVTNKSCYFSDEYNDDSHYGCRYLQIYPLPHMSRFDRVKQWAAFSRNWHIYDAKWQNPFTSAKVITRVLQGRNKAVYHPMNDSGDHVVVINSKHIALLGREWQYRVYYHHTGYPAAFKHMGAKNGKLWIPAWQLHERDPTLILWKAVYNNMENTMMRKNYIARLHIFPEAEVTSECNFIFRTV